MRPDFFRPRILWSPERARIRTSKEENCGRIDPDQSAGPDAVDDVLIAIHATTGRLVTATSAISRSWPSPCSRSRKWCLVLESAGSRASSGPSGSGEVVGVGEDVKRIFYRASVLRTTGVTTV